jgi:hypothetical protein
MTTVAAVLLTTGGASASTGESGSLADAAWAAAVKSDSLEAYAGFVMSYPESAHARVAYDRLSGIEPASTAAGARPQAATLLGDDQSEKSAPGNLPGMIMII